MNRFLLEVLIAILDINSKGEKDGIWVGEQIYKYYHIPFIFLTAFTDSATVKKAVKAKPFGYLVKPFTQPSVFAAIEVALSTYNLPQSLNILAHQHIFVKEDKIYKKVFLRDIRYIEAYKNYLEISLTSGRHVIRSTLKDLMEQLPENHFLQCHRSFVINKNFVEFVSGNYLKLSSKEIPLTKSFREGLLEQLEL